MQSRPIDNHRDHLITSTHRPHSAAGNTGKIMTRQPSRLLFYAVSAFMASVSIVAMISALSWINKPFPGFLTFMDGYVGTYRSSDWSGMQAGLVYLDRIVAVDDQPVKGGRDILNYVRTKAPRTLVAYTVEAEGQRQRFVVPVDVFGTGDFFGTVLFTYLGGIVLFVLGFVVYLLKPDTATSWVFLLLCLFLGTYMVTAYDVQSTYTLAYIHYLALCFMPAPCLHLGLIFPERKPILDRFPFLTGLVYLPAALLALFLGIYLFHYSAILDGPLAWLPGYKQLGAMARLYAIVGAFGLIALVLMSYFKAKTPASRQRAKMVLFGVTTAFVPSVVFMLLVNLHILLFPYNLIVFFILLFPIFIGYSIVRHNLFEADAIIRRTVGYVIVTAVVVGIYVLVTVTFNLLLGQYRLAQSPSFPILFTIGVILVFNPLRNNVQALVDRIFFRKEYDYGAIVEKVSGAMTSLLDLNQILRHLVRTFTDDMFVDSSTVLLLDPAGNTYQVRLAEGEKRGELEQVRFMRDDPLMNVVEEEKRELTKYDLLEDPRYRDIRQQCKADFEALRATLIIPLTFQEKVIGFLGLGDKKSGKFYNREDIDLLRTLAYQSAVAIENARLFQENLEKQRMEEELNIAHDLQVSMLPAECPQIAGFVITAASLPAREVGGDFYDFFTMDENRLGMIIGDVTGKSVSGALVMSAARSVFRMLSEEQLAVDQIMNRANYRTKQDIKSGMFVALLYAVLDAGDNTVSLCSAGQTQPIHLSRRTGEVRLIETEGDTFPLGILAEADYRETRLPLSPGDMVVFYTDGIVEAMNPQREIFGFERLLEVIGQFDGSSPEILMRSIMENVDQFAGEAEQHDDLTVIVVAVTG